MGGLLADGARKHSLRSTANGSVGSENKERRGRENKERRGSENKERRGSENKERRGSAQLTAPRNAETMDATSLIETPGGG